MANAANPTMGMYKDHKFASPFNTGMFELHTEFAKSLKIATDPYAPHATRSNRTDYDAANLGHAGFLMALVPATAAGVKCAIPLDEKGLGMKMHALGINWVMLSTYITKDIAFEKYAWLHDNLDTVLIAYSTPEQIVVLSEEPNEIRKFAEPFYKKGQALAEAMNESKEAVMH